MSEDPAHGATKIHASKHEGGGNGAKWLLGAVAAVALVGGGYAVWKNYSPSQNDSAQVAYNDEYASDDALRVSPVGSSDNAPLAESAALDDTAAPTPSSNNTATVRRSPTRTAAVVPEETIGITPASYTTGGDPDDIVVTAARRPVWARTPSERRLSALYPERALERGREGEARLACIVQDQGMLDCDRVSETPGGFGMAAVRVARSFRHAEYLADGSNATGTPVNLRVVFRIADEDQRRRG